MEGAGRAVVDGCGISVSLSESVREEGWRCPVVQCEVGKVIFAYFAQKRVSEFFLFFPFPFSSDNPPPRRRIKVLFSLFLLLL